MNVYEKLQKCRVELQNMELKKSGKNTYAKYEYFELGDFLPRINQLFNEHKLFSQVTFDKEMATLKIINTEKPEEVITFTSPMASAELKGCHEIQNLGAVETYQRRYLYVSALEIVEHDALDRTTGKESKGKKNEDKPDSTAINSKQVGFIKTRVLELVKMGAKEEGIYAALKGQIGNFKDITDLTYDQAVSALEHLEKWKEQYLSKKGA